MLGAGLLAKKAIERGLSIKPVVKTSFAPGSRVVTEYMRKAGLQEYLDRIGFNTVGYGCTTCIGNSGPLDPSIEEAITAHDLIGVSVLSGNRNFEARVHQSIQANFLMSPPLVVAFAIAGRIDIDMTSEPLGKASNGEDVFLRDIWPSMDEIREAMSTALSPDDFRRMYSSFADQNPLWNEIPSSTGLLYDWDGKSTYIQEPPFFENFGMSAGKAADVVNARPLAIFGDSVTTDHISPAGSIKASSSAGRYLVEQGVDPQDFNSYGSRRGNDRVMTRGTFANVRIKNLMVPGVEGGVTVHYPSRRAAVDLRRRDEVRDGEHSADRHRRPRVRHRQFPRLGRERHETPRRPRRRRAKFRADPPLESRGDGRLAVAVRGWDQRGYALTRRDGDVRRRGDRGRTQTAADGDVAHPPQWRHDGRGAGDRADRYADRGRLLRARRDSAVRVAAIDGGGLTAAASR